MHSRRHQPRHPVLRIARNVAGIALVLLGIVGLFLPILQGILFIVIGLALIDLPAKHRLHRRLSRWRRYRWIALGHHRAKRKLRRKKRKRDGDGADPVTSEDE